MFETLRELVSYRTISAHARYKTDGHKCASYLRSVFKKFGAVTELLNVGRESNPVLLGHFNANSAARSSRRRILFYGHYDVIAADDKQKRWIADPFSMTSLDGYFYGRGTSDNKGPVVAAIYAAADLASRNLLAADVVFLIEGEEEHGSNGFQDAVRENKARIGQVDWILLANSYWIDDEVPCLTYGLRGVIHANVEIQSEHPDLHSGVDGSRLLDEPLKDLVSVMAKLTGPHGTVQLPAFYDPILPITAAERHLYDEVSQTLLLRNPNLGTVESLTESLVERWRNPCLTIHGFKMSGSEKSTIIPSSAKVDLSLRLVPHQEVSVVAKALRDFLEHEFSLQKSKNTMTFRIDRTAEPWLGDPVNEIYRALEDAIAQVWSSTTVSHPERSSSSSSVTESPNATNYLSNHRRMMSLPKSNEIPATSSTLASSSTSPTTGWSSDHPWSDETTHHTIPMPPSGDAKRKPLFIREGGSIPAIRFLEKEFSAPAAHFPCGQASDNAHLDNERIRVLNLLNARKIFQRVFHDLSLK